ncbi:hypothetical protein ColTof4_02368 [Colletotrichum tofieldiae]|nr:hypothetical protein ColTof3_09344 [Colletotrichum tofieldiae]GKT69945.1 hypothetical protein ColTof4_02368 [Colletotrichum tofieldiae]GKT92962.1 hypothetical protein Ct61P_10812 [Colletotrichum tofieldiae]
MKGLRGMLADAYATWLSPLTNCCAPLSICPDKKPRQTRAHVTAFCWDDAESSRTSSSAAGGIEGNEEKVRIAPGAVLREKAISLRRVTATATNIGSQ